MPKRPNYHQERTQRTRSREQKQQEKQARREEASAKRKASRGDETEHPPIHGQGPAEEEREEQ
ncbi:MAG TPA: hypothetical protein VGF97_17585 [Rhizomicrobium sp.]|jgi:hypothetical protein